MRSLTEIGGHALAWRRNKELKQEYQLVAGDPKNPDAEVFAQLLWEKERGSLVHAQYGEYAYTFKRTGIFTHKFTVRAAGSDVDILTFEPHWGMKGLRGTLQLASGAQFNLEANMWNGRLKWLDSQSNLVIGFKNETGWSGLKHTDIEIYRMVESVADFGLLLTFGQYLNILAYNDANTAAVASI